MHITASVYDNANRKVSTIYALLERGTTIYDASGRVVASINSAGVCNDDLL